jgi:hypothetical protein
MKEEVKGFISRAEHALDFLSTSKKLLGLE